MSALERLKEPMKEYKARLTRRGRPTTVVFMGDLALALAAIEAAQNMKRAGFDLTPAMESSLAALTKD